ncbi:uncharacterized protein At2g29880-like [Apium graveolens]|uniref:uncharacterized protein At2g29880-like n=1 Tax=Apium graveolens TaxID=4045 RepID=UPI003D7B52A6
MDDVQTVKKRAGYDQWSQEESNALLEIMVDAENRGWRDNSVDRNGLKIDVYTTLLKFNSGFGYDSISKRFTAPNEVWDEQAHPKDGNLRNRVCDDYEDLQIVVGGVVVVGKNSIGLGSVTDARTLKASEV